MASTTTHYFPFSAFRAPGPVHGRHARRRISSRAGRAIRLLGHAIEYVANEFLHDSVPPSAQQERLQAVQILMTLNRQVFSECPEVAEPQTFRERCRRFLSSRGA